MTDEEYDVFDYVIETEDKYLLDVRKNVIGDSIKKFGDVGGKVAKLYYNRIDGLSDDFDSDDVKCEDCEKKRKELSSNLSMIDSITKCTQSYAYDFVKKSMSQDDIDSINSVIDDIITKFNKDTLYEYNRKDIIKSVLIQLLQKKENET